MKEHLKTVDSILIKISDRKPDKAHANNANQVLYFIKGTEYSPTGGMWLSSEYGLIPPNAIYWTMLPDNPESIPTIEELSDLEMNRFLKDNYEKAEDRVAIYPLIKKVWEAASRFYGRK